MGPPSYGESIKQKNILILTLHNVEISYLLSWIHLQKGNATY